MLTKADQVKPPNSPSASPSAGALAKRPAAFPEVLPTSSRSGDGMPELRAAIARLKGERSA